MPMKIAGSGGQEGQTSLLERLAARFNWRVEERSRSGYGLYAKDGTLLAAGYLHDIHSFLDGARTMAALYESSFMTYRIPNDGLEHVHTPGWYVRGRESLGPRETATMAALAAYDVTDQK